LFLETDSVFQYWIGESEIPTGLLTDYFHLADGQPLIKRIQGIIESGEPELLKLSPRFSNTPFSRVITIIRPEKQLSGEHLVLELYPINEDYDVTQPFQNSQTMELFNSVTDFIFLCAPDHTINMANAATKAIYNTREEILGRKCYQVIHSRDTPCPDCPLPDTLASEHVKIREYFDQNLQEHMETKIYPQTDKMGMIQGFTVFYRVVSPRHQEERHSLQRKKLHALHQMASGIAHDFSNQLTVILGRLQLVKTLVEDQTILSNLSVIEDAASESSEIVQRLQDFSRQRRRANGEDIHQVDLETLTQEAMEFVRPRVERRMKRRGIFINLKIRAEDVPPVYGNRENLLKVMINLLTNAVDSLDVGGVITVSLRRSRKYTEVSVSDTGRGMSAEIIEKIFDPFFTTKGDRGTGLGLSEVYGIVQRHNGSINVESSPGEGSTFTVRIPAG